MTINLTSRELQIKYSETDRHETAANSERKARSGMTKEIIEMVREQTVELETFADVDISKIELPMIAVFNRPEDYPGKIVGRLFDGEKATNIIVTEGNVEQLRGDIHFAFPFMISVTREKNDVKSFVEAWI